MILAALSTVVAQAGGVVAGIAAMVGVLVAFWKRKPVQWAWKKLAAEPAKRWFHEEILTTVDTSLDDKLTTKMAPLMEQFRNNGGSSMKDSLDRIEERQIIADTRAARTEGKVAELETGLLNVRDDVNVLKSIVQ